MSDELLPRTRTVTLTDGRRFDVTNQAQGMKRAARSDLDGMHTWLGASDVALEQTSFQVVYSYANHMADAESLTAADDDLDGWASPRRLSRP